MNKLLNLLLVVVFGTNIVLIVLHLINGHTIAILQPKGLIADQEKNLMITAVLIMLIGVIPAFSLAIFVATRYKESNKKAKYSPDWENHWIQVGFWVFLTMIILVLSGINWVAAHKLDPHVALSSNIKPLTVQVVALRWKWLFIYPDLGIASINFLEVPEKTPLNIQLTASDTPMNSFWIPQLGGQIYAMSGMATQTHLMADSTGEYRGSNAEINGAGFAGMNFITKSVTPEDFTSWVQNIKQTNNSLTFKTVQDLSKPTTNNKIAYYGSTENNLFSTIVLQYTAKTTVPNSDDNNSNSMPGMKM